MASEVHVIVFGDLALVSEAGALVDTRLAELERSWSRFVAGSAISRLNLAGGDWVDVDTDTLILLTIMRQATDLTAGAYDPTVLPALIEAGYTRSVVDGREAPRLPAGPAASPAPGLGTLEIDAIGGRVRTGRFVAVDPGGLGKGLAADLMVAELLAAGATAALVGIGGDLRTAGDPPDGRWSIRVEHPDDPSTTITTFDLTAGGVATSTTRARPLQSDGQRSHHVIDPRSGRPALTDLVSTTVVASTAWQAEAYATAALVAGAADGYALLCAAGTPAVLVTSSGALISTPDLLESHLEHVR